MCTAPRKDDEMKGCMSMFGFGKCVHGSRGGLSPLPALTSRQKRHQAENSPAVAARNQSRAATHTAFVHSTAYL